jgi:phosphopantothenoylcysteine decarboxylase / phosphopantothenate---cysteine ligase
MSILSGKKILLGISAGIAAYKSAFLVRLFVKAGAEVKVIMTPSAKEFVTPLTLSTLSKNEVFSTFTNEENENATWNNHVELALWADFFVIAPATANTLSKMAGGICDNLLMATYLSAKCQVYYAPAMDLDMYKHQSVQEAFEKLKRFGNIQIPVGTGELASGLYGEGRMAEPEEIIDYIENDIASKLPLRDKKVLITAGPTYEAIDPVRFIGNHSSGKMGYALAERASSLGAQVILVSGPTHLTIKSNAIQHIAVTSAEEMYVACHRYFDKTDIAILSAAVADFRPKIKAEQKIKKDSATLSIKLEPTKDILASLGEIKNNQILVGFALETENELENSKKKLRKKNLDLIVLNSLNDKGAGFGSETNKITIINKEEKAKSFDIKTKSEVAVDIFNEIIPLLNE